MYSNIHIYPYIYTPNNGYITTKDILCLYNTSHITRNGDNIAIHVDKIKSVLIQYFKILYICCNKFIVFFLKKNTINYCSKYIVFDIPKKLKSILEHIQ